MNLIEAEPTVSVVIPVYNGADYLKEAIESVLAQTYSSLELIVVNDGSSDAGRTEEIARSYGVVRYFAKENGGVASALNLGIQEARGDYIAWLSHDDLFYPGKIALQIEQMGRFPEKNVVLYGNFDIINEHSKVTGAIRLENPPSPEKMRYTLLVRYPVHGCTTLIPKSCFLECGLFNEQLRTTQDYEMWFRLASRFRFIHMPEALIQTRHHSGQGTRTMFDLHVREVDELLIKFLNVLNAEEIAAGAGKLAANAYADIAAIFIERRFPRATKQALKLALGHLSTTTLRGWVEVFATVFSMLLKEIFTMGRRIAKRN
jgi:glycosyltransferase involved in cell wall biosynthesis